MCSSAERSVSVILPVLDGARFIREALDSVMGQKGVDSLALEIVVVDDGSSDGTLDIVAEACPQAVILHTPRLGPAGARNAGLARAKGAVIGFIDHDDLWPEDKLARQLATLDQDPDLDIVVGRTRYHRMPDATPRMLRFTHTDDSLHFVQLGAVLVRRRVFDRIGPFCEQLRFAEDYDFFMRARDAGLRIRFVDGLSLIYRLHATNMTNQQPTDQLDFIHGLRRSLKRRREAGRAGNLRPFSEMRD